MPETKRTYLDYAASTPQDPRAASIFAETAALTGNPSSVHAEGRELRMRIDRARAEVAGLLGADASEIVLTSGATEANGAAIRGVLRAVRFAHPGAAARVAVSSAEHASVLGTVRAAEEDGECAADMVAPDGKGIVSAEAVAAAIKPSTVIVVVQWTNNVLGTINPVADIGAAVRAERARRGPGGLPIVFLCDAVQALRTEEVRPADAGVDILTVSAHKIYGPKGVGAMRIAPGTPYRAFAGGGGHESGRRHGTENAAGIAAFGAAAALLAKERTEDAAHTADLRSRLTSGLARSAGHVAAMETDGVPGIVFLRHQKMNGDELALRLDMLGFAVSAGSACDAGSRKSPTVLAAVLDEQSAQRGGVRVSFGRGTTSVQVDGLLEALSKI